LAPCAKRQSTGAAKAGIRAAPRQAKNVSDEIEFYFSVHAQAPRQSE
jgi:hypothetical protein